jgi:hypothetical protein
MPLIARIAVLLLLPTGLVGTAGAMDHAHHGSGHGQALTMQAQNGHHPSAQVDSPGAHPSTHGDICISDPVAGGHHSDHDDCLGCCPDTAESSDTVTVVRTVTDKVLESSASVGWSDKTDSVIFRSEAHGLCIPLASRSVLRL